MNTSSQKTEKKQGTKSPIVDHETESKKYETDKPDWKAKADEPEAKSSAEAAPKSFAERKELAVSTAVNLGFPQHIVEAVIARNESNIDILSQLK